MIEVVRTRDLPVRPEAVWAVLADFAGISSWASNVDHSCLLSDQTEGVGTVRRIQTGRTTLVERVVAWDAPTALSYALEGLPPALKLVTNTWHVVATDDGSRVSLTSRIDAGPRPPQQLIARAVGRVMGRASDQMLKGLREQVS